MARYHINSKGEAGECHADKGNCPFTSAENHFDSAEEARAAFESSMAAHPAGKLSKKASLDEKETPQFFPIEEPPHKGLDGFSPTPYLMNLYAVKEGDRFIDSYGSVYESLDEYSIGAPEVRLAVVDPDTGKMLPGGWVAVSRNSKGDNMPGKFKVLNDVLLKDIDRISNAELGENLAKAMNRWEENRVKGLNNGERTVTAIRKSVENRNENPESFVEKKNGVWRARKNLDTKPFKNYVRSTPGYSESKAIKNFPEGSTKYGKALVGTISFMGDGAKPKSVRLLLPVEGNVTAAKRIGAARQLWAFTGEDPQQFEDAPDEAKERWYQSHFGRYDDVELRNNKGDISCVHDHGSFGGTSDDFKLIEL